MEQRFFPLIHMIKKENLSAYQMESSSSMCTSGVQAHWLVSIIRKKKTAHAGEDPTCAAHWVWEMLDEHEGRLLEELLELGEELGGHGSINDAVIAADADVHAQAGNDLAVLDDRLLGSGTDGND